MGWVHAKTLASASDRVAQDFLSRLILLETNFDIILYHNSPPRLPMKAGIMATTASRLSADVDLPSTCSINSQQSSET